MALEVEDGTGKANAESYASVADANTYCTARGLTAWTGTDAEKEIALRKATDHMVRVYRLRWAGVRKTATQALDWPRYSVPLPDAPVGYGSFSSYVAATVVPVQVVHATVELAVRVRAGTDLSPDIDPQVSSESVGPISVSYIPGSTQVVRFRTVDNLITPLLKGSPFNIGVKRA